MQTTRRTLTDPAGHEFNIVVGVGDKDPISESILLSVREAASWWASTRPAVSLVAYRLLNRARAGLYRALDRWKR